MEKKKILIVEDEDVMRRMLTLELEAAGYEVCQAAEGNAALEFATKECPDLIITDVLMPQLDGSTFYKELKKNKVTGDIPVIILTARGKMEDSFRVMGVDDFIAKPFDPETLRAKIKILLSHGKSTSGVLAGKKILVCGNDSETIENMVLQLKRIGCHTDLVTTGAQIISKVVMFLPQVLIMEALTEGMESHDIIKIIRQMPQGANIPILVYSYYRLSDFGSEDVRQRALSVDSAVENCREVGMTEYIGRFNESTFLKSVSKYLH